jgi:hypothetical protein
MTAPRSLVRLLSTAAFAVLTLLVPMQSAVAADYTDLWVTAGEDAWGVNFVQWGDTIFATFYIYGPDDKPVWYTAVMGYDGTLYHGMLFSEQGTYFGAPWNPADMNEQAAGTATFVPSTSNNYQGALSYTIVVGNLGTTVNKSIQRLTIAAVPLGTLYFGGQVGEYSGCTDNSLNTPYSDTFSLQLTQSSGNALSLGFAYTSKLICTLAGTLSQNGLLYRIDGASYLCSDQTDSTAAVTDLKVTAQGIEGHYSAPVPSRGAGCREDARFSAVHN